MKNESFSVITNSDNSKNIQVVLEGQLVIRNAKEIKRELLLALANPLSLELIFRNVIKVDVAVLQLLIALQKSAARLQKKVSFDFETTGYLKSIMHNSGLEKVF